jgi:hypothetical protein
VSTVEEELNCLSQKYAVSTASDSEGRGMARDDPTQAKKRVLSTESARASGKRRKAENKGSSDRESQVSSHEEESPPPAASKARKRKTTKDNPITTAKGNRSNKIGEDSSAIEIAEINYEKCGKGLKIGLYKENGVVVVHAAGVPPPSESPSTKELKRFKLSMLQVIQETMQRAPDAV